MMIVRFRPLTSCFKAGEFALPAEALVPSGWLEAVAGAVVGAALASTELSTLR